MSGELGVRLLPTTTPTWPPRALKQPTFEEMLRRFAGAIPQPFDPDTYRCETIDGVSLDPTEAFASAVVNKVRRVVVNAKGVVTDMGTARNFTGFAKHALRITGQECYWPGCWVPATRCECDHLHDHAKHGRTRGVVRPTLRGSEQLG